MKKNNQNTTNNPSIKNSNSPVSESSLDKVREILFGEDIQQMEYKFSSMEEEFVDKVKSTQENVMQATKKLEEFVNQEFKSQTKKIILERNERNTYSQQTNKRISELRDEFQVKLTSLSANIENDLNSFKKEISGQLKTQHDSLLQEIQDTKKLLTETATNLDKKKIDSESLSMLFTEMASKANKRAKSK